MMEARGKDTGETEGVDRQRNIPHRLSSLYGHKKARKISDRAGIQAANLQQERCLKGKSTQTNRKAVRIEQHC